MKRTPLRRSTKAIARLVPPKKRRRSKAERLRIYGPPGFVEWIHEQPCIACGIVGFSEVAHTKTGGMGRKAGWRDSVPLCGRRRTPDMYLTEGCHAVLHQSGRDSFEAAYDVDLEVAAISTHKLWLSETEP